MKKKPWRWWWPQVVLLCAIFFIALFFANQINNNYSKQNIASGFSFLQFEAGFEISESLFAYTSSSNYGYALLIGAMNTLKVSFVGNLLALVLGLILGLGQLSRRIWLALLVKRYTRLIRNIPLLLQLLFWYSLFTDIFPSVRGAWHLSDWVYLSNRGIYLVQSRTSFFALMAYLFIPILLTAVWIFHRRSLLVLKIHGHYPSWYKKLAVTALVSFFIILGWCGFSLSLESPELVGFNFQGGQHLSPEFSALLFGLVIYTSAFVADIVSSAILWVDKGQWEAAKSLGLDFMQTMYLIIVPQSLRVMIPPMVGQVLNLTKNSTLAVAIAYPDFVAVANTTLNQTGQALELTFLIMLFYLSISLLVSWLLNRFNSRYGLRGGI